MYSTKGNCIEVFAIFSVTSVIWILHFYSLWATKANHFVGWVHY